MSNNASKTREIELKFDVTVDQMRRLRDKRILRELSQGGAAHSTLSSVYFDTPDHQLRSHGMSLRVRRKGDCWIQTAKIGRGVVAGLSQPIEIEHAVDGPSLEIDKLESTEIPQAVSELLLRTELVPVFETLISRTTRQLRSPGGDRIEIAFDSGTVKAGRATSRICEIELELKSGEPSSLYRVARSLTNGETVRFSEWSKAERGYRLSQGEIGNPPEPLGYDAPQLTVDCTAGDAFQAQLRACNQQFAHNWRVVLETDHIEGPHQLRVGLRRLRSLLVGYRPVCDSTELRHLDADVKNIASVAGALRDADVLVDEIVADAAKAAPERREFAELLSLLAVRREQIRARVRKELSGRATMDLLLKLGDFAESPKRQFPNRKSRDLPISDIARAALEKSWHRVEKWGKIIDELSIEERHEMRKALKKLRYQVDAFGDLYSAGNVKTFRTKLKVLQDVFGYLNDVAMAENLSQIIATGGAKNERLQHAAGFVLGWHSARAELAWQRARSDWKALRSKKPFWQT